LPADRCDLLCLDLPRAEEIRRGLDFAAAGRGAASAKALGDPTRLTIAMALLEGQELCVWDLGWITTRAENLVGHHLRVLRDAGWRGRVATGRSCSTPSPRLAAGWWRLTSPSGC
jgi:hypothetical protein